MSPGEQYDARCEQLARERDRLSATSSRLSNLRLFLFVAAALAAGWAFWSQSLLLGAIAAVLVAGFVAVVVHHRRIERTRLRAGGLWRIDDAARKRLARDWEALPVRHALRAEPDHPYAVDLDVFGRASVLHLLESIGTRMGEQTLSRWLLWPAPPETVRERQAAVRELAPMLDWRDELAWRAGAAGEARPDPAAFLAWAEAEPWLSGRSGLVWGARLSPLLLWVCALAQYAGLIASPYPIWALFLAGNLVVGWLLLGPAQRTLAQVASVEKALGSYADAFEWISASELAAPAFRQLRERLSADGLSAGRHVRRLDWLASLAFPMSSMLSGLVQATTLWDVHVLFLLERWQVRFGPRARGWLDALGEAEALAALAGLAQDHPTWAFPTIDPDATTIDARQLGHPLLPNESRVVNDVTLGPPGTFLLVTGSNMSGKSTLLRAIGVNVVLAQAGGPVCASALRLPPVALWTSMRVQDSLERGVSYFMAELQRLKQIVDATLADRPDDAGTLVYLLDEVLQGTNSYERQIAARRVIRLLVDAGAIGAVSTHDLTLADPEEITAAARQVHFTEIVTDGAAGPRMSFDYKLRPGIATSTNALRLMEIVGLDVGAR